MKHSGFGIDNARELGGARARFAAVAWNWSLDAKDAARLLGLAGDWSRCTFMDVVRDLDADAETRMRLACDIDGLLWRLVPDDAVAEWLRTPGVGYEDQFVTPLEALSTGVNALRALRRYLEGISSATEAGSVPANDP